MRVLVACEFSGTVRDAFIDAGHDAMSCDLYPSETPGPHYRGDVRDIIADGWDLMIAHPECRYLAVSGNRWMKNNPNRQQKREEAVEFFMEMINADIPRIAVENPVCIMSTRYRKPNQYIQPYMFGHPETKKTGLWLKDLPLLQPTDVVEPEYIISKDGKRYSPIHYMSQWSANGTRSKERSRTYPGIAKAMAEQWGSLQ
jgi:hypothetical protein